MKYTYLQVQEEAFSEECYLDTKPFAQSKLNHTAKKSLKHDSATVSCRSSQSTGTSKNLTGNHGAEKRKLSRAVFPAKTLAHAEKEQESKGKDLASGKKWQESFARYAPGSRLWKTHQRSLFGDWEQYLETWPKWGWMRDGECWALTTPENLNTSENESGYLPTPCASDAFLSLAKYATAARARRKASNKKPIQEKYSYALFETNIPTTFWQEITEDVMGFPNNWTDESNALEMHKFQQWQQWHSEFLAKD